MKKILCLRGWEIKPWRGSKEPGAGSIQPVLADSTEPWVRIDNAMEVQEALISKNLLPPSIIEDGRSEYCNWIGEADWVYRCYFDKPGGEGKTFVHAKGIDTVGDIYLNGVYMGQSRSMYLDFRFVAENLVEKNNELVIYIHAHKKMVAAYQKDAPDHWRGSVEPEMMLRKSRDYGASRGYRPIGLFDDVLLECVDRTEITHTNMTVNFSLDFTEAAIHLFAEGQGDAQGAVVQFSVEEESGANAISAEAPVQASGSGWTAETTLRIVSPRLWWPKNYGDHPRYRIGCRLCGGGETRDEVVKYTGLRHVRLIGSMRFEVNGVEVFWWGSGITPINGLTNRYRHDIALDLIERFDDSNMNGLRIWGPGRSYPDAFYDELDKRGIMVWQDFPTGGGQIPDTPEYEKIYGDEATYMIRRLKAHPCIMLWCGGNEHIYMCELDGKPGRIGFDMLHYGYRKICNQYDPQRYYHVSSPYEGRYANDPSSGDSHGSRAYCAFTPGEDYGVFFSEDIRVFPPQYKSARRFMKENIWEDNYVDTKPFGTEFAMPKGWKEALSNNGHWKLGPIDHYYSGRNAEELIYKYAAAAAEDLYAIGARARTGNPPHRAAEGRRSSGHLFWKFNDPWPRFYCSFYDYYGECTLPYYAVKRVFSPFLIHIETGDHIVVWGVNDTRLDRFGFLTVKVYDMQDEKVAKEITIPAAVPAGRSVIITNLDALGPIKWKSVLYAAFSSQAGDIETCAHGYVTRENMLPFPNAELSLKYEPGIITVTADRFARSVELSGISGNGDEFGWYFEDNYFDLLPFEVKRVRVSGKHRSGVISAKAHYAGSVASIPVELDAHV